MLLGRLHAPRKDRQVVWYNVYVIKTGILLHVYHLDTTGWEELVWGRPEQNELGTAAKFAECLLDIPVGHEVSSIIYCGPSEKDGLTEAAFAKKYLLHRIDDLAAFPRLKRKIDRLSSVEYETFVGRLHDLVVGPLIKNTTEELNAAATYFADKQVDVVIQIAAATHAPRCLREQISARYHGLVDKNQQWFVAASDVNYEGVDPDDVVIAEPMHRHDNPLYGFRPAWAEVTKKYPRLSLENKKQVLRQLDKIMNDALDSQPVSTEVRN